MAERVFLTASSRPLPSQQHTSTAMALFSGAASARIIPSVSLSSSTRSFFSLSSSSSSLQCLRSSPRISHLFLNQVTLRFISDYCVSDCFLNLSACSWTARDVCFFRGERRFAFRVEDTERCRRRSPSRLILISWRALEKISRSFSGQSSVILFW